MVKVLFLTTSLGKKFIVPMFQLDVLVLSVSYQVKLSEREPSSCNVYRSSWEISAMTTSCQFLSSCSSSSSFTHPQNKNSEFCAPLTSFDWNETDPNLLGASSIDTTCTIWGLEVSPPYASVYLCGSTMAGIRAMSSKGGFITWR